MLSPKTESSCNSSFAWGRRICYRIPVALYYFVLGAFSVDSSSLRSLSGCSSTPMTDIDHIVVVIQENHSFDSYFGRYCTASPYSNPTCNYGPSCCEASPDSVTLTRGTAYPTMLYNGDEGRECAHDEDSAIEQMNGGQWNGWDTDCYSICDSSNIPNYFKWVSTYAMSDRFFQSAAGASYENGAYFAFAKYLFSDNEKNPSRCATYDEGYSGSSYGGPYGSANIGSILDSCGIDWKMYIDTDTCNGYIPFAYSTLVDQVKHFRDFNTYFLSDIAAGKLPAVSYIKPSDANNGKGSMTDEESFLKAIVDSILGSSLYAENTLIFVSHDEGGGFYDHLARGGSSNLPLVSSEGKYYGPRIPAIAIGNVAKKNYISHVPMEPTSIIKFIEYNWFGGITGQLGARDTDASVNSLDDLIEPACLVRGGDYPCGASYESSYTDESAVVAGAVMGVLAMVALAAVMVYYHRRAQFQAHIMTISPTLLSALRKAQPPRKMLVPTNKSDNSHRGKGRAKKIFKSLMSKVRQTVATNFRLSSGSDHKGESSPNYQRYTEGTIQQRPQKGLRFESVHSPVTPRDLSAPNVGRSSCNTAGHSHDRTSDSAVNATASANYPRDTTGSRQSSEISLHSPLALQSYIHTQDEYTLNPVVARGGTAPPAVPAGVSAGKAHSAGVDAKRQCIMS